MPLGFELDFCLGVLVVLGKVYRPRTGFNIGSGLAPGVSPLPAKIHVLTMDKLLAHKPEAMTLRGISYKAHSDLSYCNLDVVHAKGTHSLERHRLS